MKSFTTTILEADDGTGDGILQFPEEFIQEEDWREGDRIHMELVNNELVIKNIDWIERESLPKQIPLPLD